jgi:hypothetical protein
MVRLPHGIASKSGGAEAPASAPPPAGAAQGSVPGGEDPTGLPLGWEEGTSAVSARRLKSASGLAILRGCDTGTTRCLSSRPHCNSGVRCCHG